MASSASIQEQLLQLSEVRQKLESQLQENDMLRKELDLVKDSEKISKLIDTVLIPQDKSEVIINVEKRLDFIKKEIASAESKINQLSQQANTMAAAAARKEQSAQSS